MAVGRHSKQTIFQRAINKVSGLKGLVEAVLDADGNIKFQSSFDGKKFDAVEQAVGHIEATGINDYRVFGPRTQVGSRKGLEQIASEAELLSERLQNTNLTDVQRAVLQKLGLGDVIGQNIDITYQKFNYEGKAQKLSQIVNSDFVKSAGIVNITDEGVTALNYRVGKKVLSSQQAKDLRYVLGLGTLTDSFVDKLFGSGGVPDFGGFAKLPKRIQGMLAERDVSITKNVMDDLFAPVSDIRSRQQGMAKVFQFDDVSAFYRAMMGMATTEEERFLLTGGLGFTDQQVRGISLGTGGVSQLEYRLGKKFQELTGINVTGAEGASNLEEMKRIFTDEAGSDFSKFKKIIKQRAEDSTLSDDVRNMSTKMKASFDAIERMRDGEFIGNVNLVDQFIDDLKSQRKSIIDSVSKLSPNEISQISELDSQIESLLHMKEAGQEGLDSAIARIQFPGMQGKGEIFLRRFSWLPKGLRDKMLIMPQSALKSEVQGVPSILLNVAKTHAENIYSDPLMLLYHQDYFGEPEFLQGAVKTVEKQRQAIQSFMETGALPDDVRKEIFGAISSELKEDADILPKLDSAAKASYLKNRAEAKTIQEMMLAGVDPRQIPALVRRITDHFTKNAYRMKGERIDLVMPDAMRLALRTYESSAESGAGASLYQKAAIRLSELGEEGTKYSAMLGSMDPEEAKRAGMLASDIANINFAQFRIQGNRMMLNGAAAHLYHHALGTFDLDDKGVPIMTTFKDAMGNDRLAFMTMRQPTGFQEKIFMQGDLTDTSTLRAILQKSDGDFSGLLNDADAASSLSDPKEQRVLELMRQAMNEKGNLDFRGLSSQDVERVLIKLRKGFGDKHGFVDLMKMTSGDLLEMAVSQSASPLGMDKLIKAGIGTSDTIKDFRSFLSEISGTADGMPDYTKGNFITLIAKEEADIRENRIVKGFNRRHRSSFGTLEDIKGYMNTLDEGSEEYALADARLKTVLQSIGESLQKSSVPAVDDTLGLYINRQAAAISMYQQVDDVLSTLQQRGIAVGADALSDYYRANFSTTIIPPSPAVDVSKSLVAKMVVDEEKMRQAAKAADLLRGTTGVSEAAVEKVMSQLMGKSIKLGQMGDIALTQTGRGVGFLRAAQIAQGGFTADELIGFDAALFGDGPYARLRKQDTLKTLRSVLEGANEYLSKITDDTERSRVQSFIDEIRTSSTEEALARLTIDPASRYAVVGKYAEAAMNSKELIDNTSAFAKRASRTGVDPYEAVMQAKYMSRSEALLESQRGIIDRIVDLSRAADADKTSSLINEIYTTSVGSDLYRGLSAMAEADPTINILDAFDTLEATIRTEYNQKVADRVLNAELDIRGQEGALIQMRQDARTRRVSMRTIRGVSDEAYENVRVLAGMEGFGDLKSITSKQAKEYVEDQIRLMFMSGQDVDEYFAGTGRSPSFFDFMRLTSGEVVRGRDDEMIYQEGADVFARVTAEKEIDRINSTATSRYVVSGSDIGDDARRVISDADAADDVTSVARGSYKRIQDFIKDGSLKNLFEDKLIKRSTFAIAGLAAFGFIYSARKDRTAEDIQGPPLLPGGSAYETDYPKQLPSISDLKYLNPTTFGMQYKINVSGSQQDIEKMQYLAAGVVGGNVDSTIYNSLPRLGRDPYSEVASRF